MSPRTGRPKTEDPKNQQLRIRLRREKREQLERCAAEMDTTKTAVIEHGIDLVEQELQNKKK